MGTASSLALGWWGIPWGLIMTPVQVVRNVTGLISPPDPIEPSEKLKDFVRLSLVGRVSQSRRTGPGQV